MVEAVFVAATVLLVVSALVVLAWQHRRARAEDIAPPVHVTRRARLVQVGAPVAWLVFLVLRAARDGRGLEAVVAAAAAAVGAGYLVVYLRSERPSQSADK